MKKRDRQHAVLLGLGLAVLSFGVFYPVLRCEFVSYDDPSYVTQNPDVKRGLTVRSVVWAFTTLHAHNWHPVTWLSHMLDCQLFGQKAAMHHLTNLLLHMANTVLLFLILARVTKAAYVSAFVAALFAVHPLHIQSVAWVAERKDVLSTLFWLLTMAAYINFAERPSARRYLLALPLFAVGLMAKPMLVSLPVVLLLLDYWPLGRLQLRQGRSTAVVERRQERKGGVSRPSPWRLVLEKIPFGLLALVSCVVTVVVQHKSGAMDIARNIPLSARIANAVIAYAGYLGKTVWPARLAVFYPHPGSSFSVAELIISAVLLAAISVLAVALAKRKKYLIVGWLWYLITLVPVVGIVQVGRQQMADRYTYVPLIGIFVIIAFGAADIVRQLKIQKIVTVIAVAIVLPALGVVTRVNLAHWRNSVTLFEHAVAVTESNSMAQSQLGAAYLRSNKYDRAIELFGLVLAVDPNDAAARGNLGAALYRKGQYDRAAGEFQRALELKPDMLEARMNLATVLARQGKLEEATEQVRRALQSRPDFAPAHLNIAMLLSEQGQIQSALEHLDKVLQIDPKSSEARKLRDKLLRQSKDKSGGQQRELPQNQ